MAVARVTSSTREQHDQDKVCTINNLGRFSKARGSLPFNRILRSIQQGRGILQTQCRTAVAGKTPGDGRARRGSPVAHGHAYAGYLASYYSMSTREYDRVEKPSDMEYSLVRSLSTALPANGSSPVPLELVSICTSLENRF